MPRLEVPIFSADFPGEGNVPHRLELNAPGSYPAGGLTPSLEVLQTIVGGGGSGATSSSTSPAPKDVPLRIMIRPRGPPPRPVQGRSAPPDFIYSDAEFGQMKDEIRAFRSSGLLDAKRGDGFVFGVLSATAAAVTPGREETGKEKEEDEEEGEEEEGHLRIDLDRNRELVAEAAGLSCTFHRAVDDVLGPQPADGHIKKVATDLLGCGFDAVLTSGGPGNAVDHLDALERLGAALNGRMEVIVGGGVRVANSQEIVQRLGRLKNVWLHSSCLVSGEFDEKEVKGLLSHDKR